MSNHETGRQPTEEKSIAANGASPLVTPWKEAAEHLKKAPQYWLATVDPDGQPHVMPVFGVWVNGTLYFTSSPKARKAKNIEQNSHCTMSVSVDEYDLMVEGDAVRITDEGTMKQVAEAYAAKYDWPITPRDGAYDAPYGAPTAGPPPYQLYEVRITKAFGFHTAEPHTATRWLFV